MRAEHAIGTYSSTQDDGHSTDDFVLDEQRWAVKARFMGQILDDRRRVAEQRITGLRLAARPDCA